MAPLTVITVTNNVCRFHSLRLFALFAALVAVSPFLCDCPEFAVLYIDIDNFKAYNDTYGFLQGDEVIKFFAETLISVMQDNGTPADFLGHIGGDDFIAITVPEKAEEISSRLIRCFDQGIKNFYNSDDWERGYVLTVDRKGRERVFPILTLSIAIVSNEYRRIDSHWLVSEIAAELKQYAKTYPGSIYVRDRRRQ